MSIRAVVPGERGGEATQDVAALLAGIALPSIERFGPDNVALAGLPDHYVFPVPDPEPPSRASVARAAIASGMASLEVLRGLENTLAACKAALVDRVLGAVAVESTATGLTRFQEGMAGTGCIAEIAAALRIPERSAAALAAHSTDLVRHPRTQSALGTGVLSWRHACTILAELSTLAETPTVTAEDAAAFEEKLLLLAQGCTASRFAAKVRRARESVFPDSLAARTKEAFRSRRISNDPGKDGMNWIELHVPTIAANAIMVHCTRTARAIKADALERQRAADAAQTGEDCREHRTLDQIRADVAAILLMGQQLPTNASYTTGTGTGGSAHTAATTASWDPGSNSGSNSVHEGSGRSTTFGDWTGGGTFGEDPGGGAACGEDPNGAAFEVDSNGGITFGDDPGGGVRLVGEEPPWAHTGPGLNPTPSTGFDDVALLASVVGDDSGCVNGLIDGIPENSSFEQQEQEAYLEQLSRLGKHPVLADPPLPKALVMIKVPFLGLLGITAEPAELDDSSTGPVPLDIARKLLAASSTFLRVLTDPITGEALPMEPQRYTLRDAERSVLQALAGGCYFPNCPNPVMDTELDHVRSFELGGESSFENLFPACKRHHSLKHFKDDKDRSGNYRRFAEPWRTGLSLHGWTPKVCPDGRVGWSTPSGTWLPPEIQDPRFPSYPTWLKECMARALGKQGGQGGQGGKDRHDPRESQDQREHQVRQANQAGQLQSGQRQPEEPHAGQDQPRDHHAGQEKPGMVLEPLLGPVDADSLLELQLIEYLQEHAA